MSDCPEQAALWAHADGEHDDDVARHAAGCERCAAVLGEAAALHADLGAALGLPEASDTALTSLRQRISAQTSRRRVPSWPWLAAAAVLPAAAALLIILFSGRTKTVPKTPRPNARLAQVQRFTPVSSAAEVELVGSQQHASRGDRVRFGPEEYGRIRLEGDDTEWIAGPGSEIEIGADTIVVHAGTVARGPGATPVVTEVMPDTSRAYVAGFEAWRAGNMTEAAAQFGVAAGSDVKRVAEVSQFYLAASLGRGGLLTEAIAALQAFTQRYPGSSRSAHCDFYIGVYSERLDRPEEARAAYQRVLAATHTNLHAIARGRLARIALPRPPANAAEWATFRAAWDAQDNPRALALLEAFVRDNPRDPIVTAGYAAFHRWGCLGRLGRHPEAIRAIDTFTSRFPNHHGVAYSLYFKAVYIQRTDVPDAQGRAALDRLLRDHPNSDLIPHAKALRKRLAD